MTLKKLFGFVAVVGLIAAMAPDASADSGADFAPWGRWSPLVVTPI